MELALGTFLLMSMVLNYILAINLIRISKIAKEPENMLKDFTKLISEIQKGTDKYSKKIGAK